MSHKKIIFFSIIFLLAFFAKVSLASECSNPKAGWLFYSCWDTALGSSNSALLDGGKWDEYHIALFPEDYAEVINNPPAGGPGGNALHIYNHVDTCGTELCGNDNYWSLNGALNQPHPWITNTNPLYFRIYFYSTYPIGSWLDDGNWVGRKFFYYSAQSTNSASIVLGLYPLDPTNRNDRRMKLVIKNHTYDNEFYNQYNSEHLDGTKAWPGQQDTGIIEPNKWYSIELGYKRDATDGYLKIWKNGLLVINANKDVPGWPGYYNTLSTGISDSLRFPCFRNGGADEISDEYWTNAVISNSYIGPISGGGTPDTTPPAAPSGVTVS
jgi:hypothetical protein